MARRMAGSWACVLVCLAGTGLPGALAQRAAGGRSVERAVPGTIHVDGESGNDRSAGTDGKPMKTLSAAIALLPDPLLQSVTIEVAGGTYTTTGGQGMADSRLELMRRMRPGVSVSIVGRAAAGQERPIFAWEGGPCMVDVREGSWVIDNVQIGSGSTRQRRGVMVAGPGEVTLRNVTFRTRSQSDAAIYAHRGGHALLRGAIRINEHLYDQADDETFSGIIATDHGLVRFIEHDGASLDIGNGSLSASYYGCIWLGCEHARITSWGEQANTLAINNSGRIDLHGTTTTLRATNPRNTPIGLEHDGHVLAEDARIIIEGGNGMAIALQKASTLTCNDIELRGTFKQSVWASSGSMFVGRFLTDVTGLEADTSASINVEKLDGKLTGPVTAKRCGRIALPDRNVVSE